jgi:hypothetical protein
MLSLITSRKENVSYQVLLHRKEGRENEWSDHFSFTKLDRLNRINLLIRID